MSDRDALVALLQAQINGDVLLVNSGKSKAGLLVLACSSSESVAEDKLVNTYLNREKVDVLFAVSWVRDEPKRVLGNVPRSNDGYFMVKILAMDKLGVDGDGLRELAAGELRRIFLGAGDMGFRWFSASASDHKFGSTKIFSSVFTMVKVTES